MPTWTPEQRTLAANLKQSGLSWQDIAANLTDKFNVTRSPEAVRKQVQRKPSTSVVAQATPVEGETQQVSKVKTALVYGDTHYPFADPYAVAIMLQIAKDVQPDMIILNGDIMDNFSQSSYFSRKPANAVPHLVDEIECVKNHLRVIRNQHPKAKIEFVTGNHEDRILRLVAKHAPAFLGLPALEIPSLLDLEKLHIRYHPPINGESYLNFGSLLVGHFNRCYKHSAYTAKNLVSDKGISLIQGHTHRAGIYNVTWVKRQVIGVESGCMCTLTPEYKENPNWQQGFSIISFAGKYFSIQLVQIIRTTEGLSFAFFGDRFYSMKHETEQQGVFASEDIDRRVRL